MIETSRKHLTNKRYCNFCIHYQPTKKNGKKMSYGVCRVTGNIKSRSDKCYKNFNDKNQITFL